MDVCHIDFHEYEKKSKTRVIWFWGILIFYWLLFVLFKAPDTGDPDHYSMQGNIASYIDRLLLPGRFCCFELGDNEGILALISATGTGLLGILTGGAAFNKPETIKESIVYGYCRCYPYDSRSVMESCLPY